MISVKSKITIDINNNISLNWWYIVKNNSFWHVKNLLITYNKFIYNDVFYNVNDISVCNLNKFTHIRDKSSHELLNKEDFCHGLYETVRKRWNERGRQRYVCIFVPCTSINVLVCKTSSYAMLNHSNEK